MTEQPIDWLLEDDTPAVQYLTRLQLLGESPGARRMQRLRRQCNEYPPVATMLDRVDEAIAAGDYQKYRGAYWTLLFLAEMHADGRDARARRLAKHVLSAQLANGGFSTSHRRPQWEIVCLTGNMLRSLVHMGLGDSEHVVQGYRRLAQRILPHGGVPCVVLDYTVYTSCSMTLPQTLRCVAAAPGGAPKTTMTKLRKLLVQRLLDINVYKYVRTDASEFRAALKRRPKNVTQRSMAAEWKAKRHLPDQLLPKERWKRFGFPSSYNPDLLEAMVALTEAGAGHDPAMEDALDHIESRRRPDGRWKLDESLNGKMLASVERKGAASKWITLRALRVLAHFGRIVV